MSQYEVVVFDWDGTLMDSTRDIVRAMLLACEDVGLSVPTQERAAWVIGLSLDKALAHVAPDLTDEQRPLFLERYRYHYLTKDGELQLFDGVLTMLDDLVARGVHLAVATGKSRVGLDRALSSTNLAAYFTATRCADETFGKPHPGMLLEIMDELAVDPERVLMVGDTSHDLNMAANAGIHGLAVTYGAHTETELRQHPHIEVLSTVQALSRWLGKRTRARFSEEH